MTQHRVAGCVLVRNEERFVERAIRNVTAFCDRIHVIDHESEDATWEILQSIAREFDHVDITQTHNSALAHRRMEQYAGTPTWVIGVDGDEIYDPAALARLREDLLAGAHEESFRLKGHVLNCDKLDLEAGTASGWMSPPSRPATKLYNYGALVSWAGAKDPFQAGTMVFKDGYHNELRKNIADEHTWETDPLRYLHLCFMPRSSLDPADDPMGASRLSLPETGEYDRGPLGRFTRLIRGRGLTPDVVELQAQGRNWKVDRYAKGEHLTVDCTPFFA